MQSGTEIPAGATLVGDSILVSRCLLRPATHSLASLLEAVDARTPLSQVPASRAYSMLELSGEHWNVVEPSHLSRAVLQRFAQPTSLSRGLPGLVGEASELIPEGMNPMAGFVAAIEELCNRGQLGLVSDSSEDSVDGLEPETL